MKYKLTALTLILAMSTILVSPGIAVAQAPNRGAPVAIPITGTATNPTTNAVLNLAGTFNLQRVAVQNGQLVGIGTLVATLTDPATGVVQNIVAGGIALPLAATGTCPILHLVLGPLDLNLLGLMVHLNQVVLDITAQSGPGNLLGNLLCAVANLLNSNGALTAIANLLNQILSALG